MPRKKLLRRFDPRGGVSMPMVEAECEYVAREYRDYLISSCTELADMLRKIQTLCATSEEVLQPRLRALPNRERLALKCMLARDFFHIAAVYEQFLNTPEVTNATGPTITLPVEVAKDDEPRPILPFSEWLFNPD